jgi:predicted kinase
VTRAPTLYLTCGLPGSGKTTLAERLEREAPALRLTADQWLHELYPGISTPDAETGSFRARVESLQWPIAVRALELGCSLVLDWGVWARRKRDLCRTGAREAGARVVLVVAEVRTSYGRGTGALRSAAGGLTCRLRALSRRRGSPLRWLP